MLRRAAIAKEKTVQMRGTIESLTFSIAQLVKKGRLSKKETETAIATLKFVDVLVRLIADESKTDAQKQIEFGIQKDLFSEQLAVIESQYEHRFKVETRSLMLDFHIFGTDIERMNEVFFHENLN